MCGGRRSIGQVCDGLIVRATAKGSIVVAAKQGVLGGLVFAELGDRGFVALDYADSFSVVHLRLRMGHINSGRMRAWP